MKNIAINPGIFWKGRSVFYRSKHFIRGYNCKQPRTQDSELKVSLIPTDLPAEMLGNLWGGGWKFPRYLNSILGPVDMKHQVYFGTSIPPSFP